MDHPLADIEFLARSNNRVVILDTLATRPCTRDELREATGASRVTLGRILGDFTARGWIRQEDGEFRATAIGRLVATQFNRLIATMETADNLHDIIQWLPADDFDFQLTCFNDATIVRPTQSDPLAPVRRAAAYLRQADYVEVLTHSVAAENLEADWQAVVNGTQRFDGVLTTAVIETIRADPVLATQMAEMVETGNATVHRYEGDVPYVVMLADELTLLGITDDQRMPRALIVTDDEQVRMWATEIIDAYRQTASAVTPELFTIGG
ncbi:winged helix-turn-helix domain-containing protein [Haladaptatus sp. DYSN1]|uniref:helix-turn-helix transcriptional regulator n=1 Tax=unclassified Haladaptatus TaxID=2622732 RepID=UPI0024062467|nr:ArsR family transcriptional regulator [Haladaptatus sp. DYSN1]